MPGGWPASELLTGRQARSASTTPSAERTATPRLTLGNHTGAVATSAMPARAPATASAAPETPQIDRAPRAQGAESRGYPPGRVSAVLVAGETAGAGLPAEAG